MKKMQSIFLTAVLLVLFACSAFAVPPVLPVPKTTDMKGKMVDERTAPPVYSIDIVWGDMQFTYEKSGQMNWNADTHTYTDNTTTAWIPSGNTVSVTNHSNQAVDVALAYEKSTSYEAINGVLDKTAFTLPSATGKAVTAPELTQSATLTLSGTLPTDVTTFTQVGTVTVTVR